MFTVVDILDNKNFLKLFFTCGISIVQPRNPEQLSFCCFINAVRTTNEIPFTSFALTLRSKSPNQMPQNLGE